MNFFQNFSDFCFKWLKYDSVKPLLFTKVEFWIFFVIVFAVFTLCYKKTALRNSWLFLVSLFFYYKASGFFFILIILSVFINFWIGNRLYTAKSPIRKKVWVGVSVCYNLSWLVYFKYTYLIVEAVNGIFGSDIIVKDWLLEGINNWSGASFNVKNIFLPVGISFYSFQIISYLMDLYRGHVKPIKSVFDFGFYVTFFPQLVAGPIVRAASFVPQMYQPYKVYKEEIGQAWFLIINGLIKKIIVADYIALNFVDRVFDNPLMYSGVENLLAIYGYSIQIYCDFSGYTDIAIGLAMLMGFRLPLNFNSPYKAISITDFWRRWHISLSSWLKDYLYIPLGGNRKGKYRTYFNLFITMLLGGLWHGANLRFIVWGGLHGLYLAFHKLIGAKTNIPAYKDKLRWLKVIGTFHLVTFTWLVFRADSMQKAKEMLSQLFTNFHIEMTIKVGEAYFKVILIMFLAFLIHWLPSDLKGQIRAIMVLMPGWQKVLISVLIVFVLVQFTTAGLQPFIYFQF